MRKLVYTNYKILSIDFLFYPKIQEDTALWYPPDIFATASHLTEGVRSHFFTGHDEAKTCTQFSAVSVCV